MGEVANIELPTATSGMSAMIAGAVAGFDYYYSLPFPVITANAWNSSLETMTFIQEKFGGENKEYDELISKVLNHDLESASAMGQLLRKILNDYESMVNETFEVTLDDVYQQYQESVEQVDKDLLNFKDMDDAILKTYVNRANVIIIRWYTSLCKIWNQKFTIQNVYQLQ